MELFLIALALIFGIYLAIGVVMLAIYAILEHRTRYYRSTFNPYLSRQKWDWYDVPLGIFFWLWGRHEFMRVLCEHHEARKQYRSSNARPWNQYGG